MLNTILQAVLQWLLLLLLAQLVATSPFNFSTHQGPDQRRAGILGAAAQLDETQEILGSHTVSNEWNQLAKITSATFRCDWDNPVSVYIEQKVRFWPQIKNTGTKTWDRATLESPDLGQWKVSNTWGQVGCDRKNRTNVHCSKSGLKPGAAWTNVAFDLRLDDGDDDSTIDIPLNLTTYVGNNVEDQLQCIIHWVVRKPAVYHQGQPSSFPQSRTILLEPTVDAEEERQRLHQWFKYSDFQSTGFYLNPKSPLRVSVGYLDAESPKPQVMVGTPDLVNPAHTGENLPSLEWLNLLNNGDNEVVSTYGGILYLRYSYKKGETLPQTVTVELKESDAATPIVFFESGKTSSDAWTDMLSVNEIPFVEAVGKRVAVTGLAAHAKELADQGQDPDALLEAYEDIFVVEDTMSALDPNASDHRDQPSPLGPFIVEARNSHPTHATTYRVESWGMYHENGHLRQHIQTWSPNPLFTEVTNNIYSLACEREFNPPGYSHDPGRDWNNVKNYLKKPDAEKDLNDLSVWGRLVLFEQLRVVFGNEYLYNLHHQSRRSPDLETFGDKIHFLITTVSNGVDLNLADYFTRWGFKLEDRTIDHLKIHPEPTDDYTTVPVYGRDN
ncbi:peptidase M60-like family-domain-containing protein [Aspergillus californicus]